MRAAFGASINRLQLTKAANASGINAHYCGSAINSLSELNFLTLKSEFSGLFRFHKYSIYSKNY